MSSSATAVYRALDKATRRLLNKTNRPKQPRSPVNFYTIEKVKGLQGRDTSNNQELKNVFASYRSLSDQERQQYIREAEQDKIRFKNEFNQWYTSVQENKEVKDKLEGVAKALKDKYQRLGHL